MSIEQLLLLSGLSWQVVKLIRPKKADKVWIAPELQAIVLWISSPQTLKTDIALSAWTQTAKILLTYLWENFSTRKRIMTVKLLMKPKSVQQHLKIPLGFQMYNMKITLISLSNKTKKNKYQAFTKIFNMSMILK
jgi:hypothetical protein